MLCFLTLRVLKVLSLSHEPTSDVFELEKSGVLCLVTQGHVDLQAEVAQSLSHTSAKHTLLSFFFRVFTLLRAFLVFRTGMLIIGVLILELAIIRISRSL